MYSTHIHYSTCIRAARAFVTSHPDQFSVTVLSTLRNFESECLRQISLAQKQTKVPDVFFRYSYLVSVRSSSVTILDPMLPLICVVESLQTMQMLTFS